MPHLQGDANVESENSPTIPKPLTDTTRNDRNHPPTE